MKSKKMLACVLALTMVTSIVPVFGANAEEVSKKGTYITESNTGDLNRVPYNNPNLKVEMDAGFIAFPAVVDMNNDGVMDLLVSDNSIDHNTDGKDGATWIYYGVEDTHNPKSEDYLTFDQGRKLMAGGTMFPSYLYDAEGNYQKTLLYSGNSFYDASQLPSKNKEITVPSVPIRELYPTIDGNMLNTPGAPFYSTTLVDYDGDEKLDIIHAIDDGCYENGWSGFGSPSRYDENGMWGGYDPNGEGNVDGANDPDGVKDGDPLHGWLAWSKNIGDNTTVAVTDGTEGTTFIRAYEYTTEGSVKKIIEGTDKAIDVYGNPFAQFHDWDGDGDLDIMVSCWLNDITYFENIGTRTEPVYIQGRAAAVDKDGDGQSDGELQMVGYQVNSTMYDWNQDGYMDLITGECDGRVFFVENTGKFTEDGTPIFKEHTQFLTYADSPNIGAEGSIDSIDWDNDGDEDIVFGDDAGFIFLLPNLSAENGLQDFSNPIWGRAIPLTHPDGSTYRITGGYNGSPQSPQEELLGYSKISAGDWDGDGVNDILTGTIWGIILFLKGVEGTEQTFQFENPKPIEVEWSEETLASTGGYAPYPKWNWWKPGEENLTKDVTDPTGKVYKAQWSEDYYTPSQTELVTQWRINPQMIDLPLQDSNGDGIPEGDGLMDIVTVDHEGYLSFFERYEEDGILKLKEGQRIFTNAYGTEMTIIEQTYTDGEVGRRQLHLADYNGDGKLDLILNGGSNMEYYVNVAENPGEYKFATIPYRLHTRIIARHVPGATSCDWNQDGVIDMLQASEGGYIYYLENNLEKMPTDFTVVTPESFGIEDGTYSPGVSIQKTPIDSMDQVLFKTNIKLQDDWGTIHYMWSTGGGNNAPISFILWGGENGKFIRLQNSFDDGSIYTKDGEWAGINYYDFPADCILGSTFHEREFEFAISTEFVDYDGDGEENDLELGVWFNGTLYRNDYLYLRNCKDYCKPYLGFSYLDGAPTFTLNSPEVPIVSQKMPTDFTVVTPKSFGIEDDTYSTNIGGTQNPVTSMDKVLFKATIQTDKGEPTIRYTSIPVDIIFYENQIGLIEHYTSEAGTMWYHGDTPMGDGFIALPNTAEILNGTIRGKSIEFAISTEYVDFDGVGEKDDVQFGLWLNGILYGNKYFYITNCPTNISGSMTIGCSGWYESSETNIKVTSPEIPVVLQKMPTDFKVVTPYDFGIEDGTYTADISGTSLPLSSMDKVLFKTTLQSNVGVPLIRYTNIPVDIIFYENQMGLVEHCYNDGAMWHHGTTPKGDGFIALPNTEDILGGTISGRAIGFAVSTEYVDFDNGGEKNDMKFGLWLNGVLYGNEYFYLTNCLKEDNTNITIGCTDWYGTGYEQSSISISSPITPLEGYTVVTPKDFGDAFVGKDLYTESTISCTKTPSTSMDKVMFRATMDGNSMYSITYMRSPDWETQGLWLVHQGDGTLLVQNHLDQSNFYRDGVDAGDWQLTLTPDVAFGAGGNTFLGEYDLAITTEYVNDDGGDSENDLKVGLWFNGKLYDGKYLYIRDITHVCRPSLYYTNFIPGEEGKSIFINESSLVKSVEMQPEISDSIAMKFIVEYDPMILKTGVPTMDFRMNSRRLESVKGTQKTVGSNAYVYTYPEVMAQHMADTVTAKLTVGNIVKTYKSSMLDYCVDLIKADALDGYSDEQLAAAKELAVDLVEYGTSVQKYRNVNISDENLLTTKFSAKLAEAGIEDYTVFDNGTTEQEINLDELVTVRNRVTDDDDANGTWKSATLVLGNKVKFRYKFTTTDLSEIKNVALYKGDELLETIAQSEFVKVDKNTYYVEFDNIYAFEYDDAFTAKINNMNSDTVTYSVHSYLKQMADVETGIFKDLLVAINNYGSAAQQYAALQ